MDKSILISIPAKNEALTIARVINNCREHVKDVYGIDPEVLVIDDGSTDNTSDIAKDCGATVKRHEKSVGLGTVFQEAVEYATEAKFDYMVTIDGDGQFDESEISNLLGPLISGEADFTSGSRFISGSQVENMPVVKRYGNWMVSRIVGYILGKRFADVSCGFRAYNKKAILHLNLFGGFTYTQEVFLNLGYKGLRIKEVPVTVRYFEGRKSRIAHNLFRYSTQVMMITLSSLIFYKPLRLFGALTTVLWAVGLPVIITLGVRFYLTGLITPYKAIGIVSLLMVIMGAVSLIIGVILYALSRQQLSIDKLLYYEKRKY